MALATFSRGTKAKLDATKKTDGRIYVTTDTGNMYVDVGNETDSSAQRFLIGADGIKAASDAVSTANAAQAKADDAWSRTLRVQVSSAPADAAGDTSLLTAYAFRGGELLSDEAVAKMGLLAWYVGGSRVATGSTYTCAAGTAVECRLES